MRRALTFVLAALLVSACAERPLGVRYPRPAGIVEGDWNGCALEAERRATPVTEPASQDPATGGVLEAAATGILGTDGAVIAGAIGLGLLAYGIQAVGHAAWGDWASETVYIQALRACLQTRGYPVAPVMNLPRCSVMTPPPCKAE